MKAKLFGLLLLLSGFAIAGTKESVTISYIEKYRDVAIREMKEFGVPASITLAQGILESGSGQSYLAQRANNHFGIKCHLDWDGKRVYKDDDEKNECFRAYKDPDESFRDHSLFLKNRSRYASLFKEDPTDYKAWAHGLKRAGYATNRKYPTLLIDLIERYELHKYDLEGFKVDVEEITKNEPDVPAREEIKSYQVNVSKNYVEYVTAKK
ncbi:MAG TPA: N-acetylmuramoyl-L-alanine amidase, partial [Cryomorphaceae bacterium]|nr:N-acetylmuramoyl-L-alanine amidase [Cryomorphaceae bacterium]